MLNDSSQTRTRLRPFVCGALLFCLSMIAAAQQPVAASKTPEQAATDAKAEQIVAHAVAAVGGNTFLAVRSVVGRGVFTPFAKGMSQLPLSFTDYLVFPDRERTEFRGGGNHSIQTNVGQTGWMFDAAERSLKDQQPAQIESFQTSLRTSLDNLLRGWWRKDGATLSYIGRREASLGQRNETVRLTYPDGFVVDYEIGARDGLPAKMLYKHADADGKDVQEEDRYARYLTVEGVTLPYIIDHYRGGDQTARISYDSIEFNRSIPDEFFAKPANIKAIK